MQPRRPCCFGLCGCLHGVENVEVAVLPGQRIDAFRCPRREKVEQPDFSDGLGEVVPGLELENEALSGLALVPSDRGFVFLGKAIANFVLLVLVQGATAAALPRAGHRSRRRGTAGL